MYSRANILILDVLLGVPRIVSSDFTNTMYYCGFSIPLHLGKYCILTLFSSQFNNMCNCLWSMLCQEFGVLRSNSRC